MPRPYICFGYSLYVRVGVVGVVADIFFDRLVGFLGLAFFVVTLFPGHWSFWVPPGSFYQGSLYYILSLSHISPFSNLGLALDFFLPIFGVISPFMDFFLIVYHHWLHLFFLVGGNMDPEGRLTKVLICGTWWISWWPDALMFACRWKYFILISQEILFALDGIWWVHIFILL